MNPASLLRALLVLALLSFVSSTRAQTPEIGAQVFLAQPGAPITTTLLAAPTLDPSSFWFTQIWYPVPVTTGSITQPFDSNSAIGSTVVTPPVPYQNGLPLFIHTAVALGVLPSADGQGNAFGTSSSTGFTPANPVFAGGSSQFWNLVPNAAVVFGPNNTALIGFSQPTSPTPASFAAYPWLISLTNVWNGGGGIGAVPEPSTWMLTLVGLLAAGFVLLRRRAR